MEGRHPGSSGEVYNRGRQVVLPGSIGWGPSTPTWCHVAPPAPTRDIVPSTSPILLKASSALSSRATLNPATTTA